MNATGVPPQSRARAGTLMAVGSMTCVQIGLALSVHLFDQVGALGAAWLRLAWAGVILAAWVRPRPWRFPRRTLLAAIALGVVTAGVTMLFMASVARLPLGTASWPAWRGWRSPCRWPGWSPRWWRARPSSRS
jgi:inner membrane transporter RhtA